MATGDGGRPPTAPMALASITSVSAAAVTGAAGGNAVEDRWRNGMSELMGQVRSVSAWQSIVLSWRRAYCKSLGYLM